MTPSATTVTGALEQVEHRKRAQQVNLLVRNHTIVSSALGVVPLPAAGIVLISANCLKMLHKLSRIYGVPFRRDVGKSIISSLLIGSGTISISGRMIMGAGVLFPNAVPVVNVVTTPIFGASATYALGHLFIQHFESGGTFLTFDPDRVRGHYAKLYDEGQQAAAT